MGRDEGYPSRQQEPGVSQGSSLQQDEQTSNNGKVGCFLQRERDWQGDGEQMIFIQ